MEMQCILYTSTHALLCISICSLARCNQQSWLWHQRLSHLNFNTINELAKKNLITGLPKFKYLKEHLCPSCERQKGKMAPHKPKLVPNSKQRLHLLHMDLCGPMRVESIHGKRYTIVQGQRKYSDDGMVTLMDIKKWHSTTRFQNPSSKGLYGMTSGTNTMYDDYLGGHNVEGIMDQISKKRIKLIEGEFEISSWRGARVDVRTYLLGGAIDSSEANGIIRDPKLELESSRFTFDLVPLSYESVDVVVGENWLLRHKAEMVCHEKVVKMPWSCKVRVGSNGNLLWEASVLLGRKKGCVMDTLKFTAMPFGLTNAPAVFMDLMIRMIVDSLKEEKMYVKFSNNVEAEQRGSYPDVTVLWAVTGELGSSEKLLNNAGRLMGGLKVSPWRGCSTFG
ncbi:retrovirus-related pol polyprotein from transposon TNT 1-94 [Tanacetum coccineum]